MRTADDYLAQISSWVSEKPNFMAFMRVMLQPFADAQQFLNNMPEAFDIDTAIGNQLDIIGQWVGISRQLRIPLANVYFTWGDAALGWGKGVWKGPFDPLDGLAILNDDLYRFLLRAKIIANSWDGTVSGAATAYSELFNDVNTPGSLMVIDDQSDMTATFAISGAVPPMVIQKIFAEGLLPLKPVGVDVKYKITSVDTKPVFGWGVDNEYIGGWGKGAWAVDA